MIAAPAAAAAAPPPTAETAAARGDAPAEDFAGLLLPPAKTPIAAPAVKGRAEISGATQAPPDDAADVFETETETETPDAAVVESADSAAPQTVDAQPVVDVAQQTQALLRLLDELAVLAAVPVIRPQTAPEAVSAAAMENAELARQSPSPIPALLPVAVAAPAPASPQPPAAEVPAPATAADATLIAPGFTSAATVTTAAPPGVAMPAALAAPLDLRETGWQQAIASRIVWALGAGLQQAQLELHPEEFGRVDVNISIADGHVELTFQSGDAQARAALQAGIAQLRSAFAGEGLQLAQTRIADTPRTPGEPARAASAAARGDAGQGGRRLVQRRVGFVDDYV